jgi:hypothetical protein
MQKEQQLEQQLEGWGVVPEHCAAAQLPQLHPPHRDQQFTCNTDWVTAILLIVLNMRLGALFKSFYS